MTDQCFVTVRMGEKRAWCDFKRILFERETIEKVCTDEWEAQREDMGGGVVSLTQCMPTSATSFFFVMVVGTYPLSQMKPWKVFVRETTSGVCVCVGVY